MKPSTRGSVKSAALWALVALNLVLVTVLVMRHAPDNRAQAAAQVNAGDILAVPGHLNGFPNGVVFLLDNTNGTLTAISFDQPSQKMTSLPQPVDIRKLANAAGGVRGR